MDMNEIGVAMIGTGFMGGVHVEALKRVGVNVVGILGSRPEKSQAAAKNLGLHRGYDTFEQVLSDPKVHSVHIGTPNRTHFAMARDAILAGKHVLCEKPLAMTSVESAELVAIAKQHPNQATGVNYNIRFYPLCIEARQHVRSGNIGDVFHVTGSYVQDWLLRDTDYNWRVLAEEGGDLRAVSDIGTHWLDLIHSITGLEVESLCADLQVVHAQRKRPLGEVETYAGPQAEANSEFESIDVSTEDFGSVLLRFRGGSRGVLHVSQVTSGRKNCLRFEVAGSKQSIAWNSEQPNQIGFGNRDRGNETLLKDPSLLSPAAARAAGYPGGHNEGYADSFKACFQTFYDAIRSGDFALVDFPTFEDGHREILLCEAILASHRERKWVSIPS